MQSFGTIFTGKNNYFTALRLFAAVLVVFSHSWLIKWGELFEPLYAQTGFTLGQHAVTIFFAISGFLVCSSIQRQPNIFAFAIARLTRIFPAFLLCGILIALFGAFITTVKVDYYISELMSMKFFLQIFIFFNGETKLPGVFNYPVHENSVLATIWTLKYELICYIGLTIASLIGAINNRYIQIFSAIMLIILCLFFNINSTNKEEINTIHHFIRFLTSFYIGVLLYLYRYKIPHTIYIPIILSCITYILNGTIIYNFLLYLTIGYTSLYLALIPNSTKLPEIDMSYGVYLYGWPIQQTIYIYDAKISSWHLSIYTSLIAMIFGAISWYLIEKPSLTYARNYIKSRFNPALKVR